VWSVKQKIKEKVLIKKTFVSKELYESLFSSTKNNELFKLVKVWLTKVVLNDTLKKYNCCLYCSLDQFLWAIGDLVNVNFLFFWGKTKKCILFFFFAEKLLK
jgi:hypothetical protein